MDAALVVQLDALIADERSPNRSQAVEPALAETLGRLGRTRLARECAKLDPEEERAWAEEGLSADVELRPEY